MWEIRIISIYHVFPQIAIAIGVLTSNRGGGRRTTLADWTWHQGAIAGCNGRGAIAGCHRRVPLQCAMVRGEGDDQLWGSGRGAIAGCHCSVLWLGASVTTNFGGVDVVHGHPAQQWHPEKKIQKNCLELLADVTLFSPLITQKLKKMFFAIWGLCWYIFVFFCCLRMSLKVMILLALCQGSPVPVSEA